MLVHLHAPNPALQSLFTNPRQVVTLDASFLIAPYRSFINGKYFTPSVWEDEWLNPLFSAFPNLALHEAVYEELVTQQLRTYVDTALGSKPPRLTKHSDSSLSYDEKVLRATIEERIYPHTKYDPAADNRDDRGEVKSLAYIATKGLVYFASHDATALQLISRAEEWRTALDNVRAVQMYEVIFYLTHKALGCKEFLRLLYKHQYFLTAYEKEANPNWADFVKTMETLYCYC